MERWANHDRSRWVHPPVVSHGKDGGDESDGVGDDVKEMVLCVSPNDLVLEASAVHHQHELYGRCRDHNPDHPLLLGGV